MDTVLFDIAVSNYSARFQKDLDLKGFQVDGIFGNVGHESNGLKSLQEIKPIGGGSGGYGWPQFTGPRRVAYLNYCTVKKLDPSANESNYLYMVVELKGEQHAALIKLQATRTRDNAVQVFMDEYERPNPLYAAYASRVTWAERAEFIRVKTEGSKIVAEEKPVIETSQLHDMLAKLARDVETLAEKQAVAMGVPQAIITLLDAFLSKIDVGVMLQKGVEIGLSALAKHAAK